MNSLKSLMVRSVCFFLLSLSVFAVPMHAVSWFPLGPYGGDARSFAADPSDSRHLYLGSATGWIYESHNGGERWVRLSQLAGRNDMVIDHILPDARHPRRLVVGAWIADHPDGGIFISEDGGRSWSNVAEMRGQSVISLARADSDPNLLVAGTLQGIFRSTDDGLHWSQISPAGSTEIHEVESLAIDPRDPKIIYAGTWHLPWKTVDGGVHWVSIKRGIIEDSDVFSIVIDPAEPQTVYASACSGIYKSVNAAMEFKKVQGIPSSARRTRKLEQDPEHLQTVYAGTTEGLYRTLDGGKVWNRLTGSDLIINDVYVDPHDSGHVLLATDRGGVMRSEDFAASFHESNMGFSARQVVAYAADPNHPSSFVCGSCERQGRRRSVSEPGRWSAMEAAERWSGWTRCVQPGCDSGRHDAGRDDARNFQVSGRIVDGLWFVAEERGQGTEDVAGDPGSGEGCTGGAVDHRCGGVFAGARW